MIKELCSQHVKIVCPDDIVLYGFLTLEYYQRFPINDASPPFSGCHLYTRQDEHVVFAFDSLFSASHRYGGPGHESLGRRFSLLES
jgi:hypothetical protein